MSSNPYKTGGPEVDYVIESFQCCRIWPVVTATLTWDARNDIMKRESWWVRTCGYCGEYPRPIQEERP